MPEQLLNVLKLCLLILLYLFFLRVARAVWVEVNGPRLRTPRSAKPRSGTPVVGAPVAPPAAMAGAAPAGGGGRAKRPDKPARGTKHKGARAAKAAAGQPALVVVAPQEHSGRRYDLADELTMGRAAGCRITLDDTYVSQLHARVFVRENAFYVEDLGSTNGTYLNRKKVSGPLLLKAGDQVQVGSTVLELVT